MTRRARWVVLLGIAALVSMWPAFYNGQPFFFGDTSAYVRGADAGIEKLTGIRTAWSVAAGASVNPAAAQPPVATAQTRSDIPPHTSVNSIQDKTVLSGRSVYYGALLYLGYLAGNFWLTVWLQSLALVAALAFTLRACSLLNLPNLALLTLLACITPAALFASLLMPDLFAGLTILACAILLASARQRDRIETAFWFALLVFALLSHVSHVLIAAIMLVCGTIAYVAMRQNFRLSGLLAVSGALLLAWGGELAFNAGVTRFLGAAPLRPPFVMARILQDGPGYRYLRATCPANGFVVCRFVDRLPLSSDDFLWATGERGVFSATDPAARRALSQEQFRFALHAALFEPWQQARASLGNAGRQLSQISVPEFKYWDGDKLGYEAKIPRANWLSMSQSAAYRGTMPVGLLSLLSKLTASIGAAYVLLRLAQRGFGVRGSDAPAMRIALFVLMGILANALVCGTLSMPANRYAARVVWLLPMMALLLDLDLRRAWWAGLWRRAGLVKVT
jgi:hypothetical protein